MSLMYIDACCDLSSDRLKTMSVEVVEQTYTLDSIHYTTNRNNKDDLIKVYAGLKEGRRLNTHAIDQEKYAELFSLALKQGEDILYIHSSAKINGSINNMYESLVDLKNDYSRQSITTFDTKAISVQAGLIAYEGAVMHRRCDEDKKIVDALKEVALHTAFYFVVDNLKNIDGTKLAQFQSANNALIKPIFAVNDDGEVVNVGKAQGKKKAILELVDKVKNLGENLADYPIAIVHANCENDANLLKDKLLELLGGEARIWIEEASPITVAHVGTGAIGVAFHAKKRI